ncbi:MAG: lipoyl(octanoyl) transferase LipB [Bacillota bacterium]
MGKPFGFINLKEHRPDIHWYVRQLEEVLIRTAVAYGLPAGRRPGLTGVWVGSGKPASIGVAVRRWVTMHGFAFNVANDLSYFELIHPCGLKNVAMTSFCSAGPAG